MAKAKGYGIGIDFGTTNSVLSVYDTRIKSSRPYTSETGLPHPSVVWYKADGSKLVGEKAKEHIMGFSAVTGNHFEVSIKRRLGREVRLDVFGKRYPAWQVATHIFEYLLLDARGRHDGYEFSEAILTIPVYFGGAARRELRRAADAAGLYIKNFVHEPFAAIVGYCAKSGNGFDLESLRNQHIMVFDWGGGTLDITLVKVDNVGLVELAIGGIADRAGDHFDEELMKFARNEKLEALRADSSHVLFSPGDLDRLRSECERAKISLSGKGEERIQIAQACKYGDQYEKIDQPLTQSKFASLIQRDVTHAVGEVHRVLEDARVSANAIDTVLLIGGSSRIPSVRAELREIFGRRMVEVPNANTIISEGAAIVDALGLQPVLSRSISVELSDGTHYEVISAGTPATSTTCRNKLDFYCTDNRDGQAKLVVTDQLDGVGSVGRRTKEVIPIPVSADLPKPYNHERVNVEFAMDQDLVLKVAGKGATQATGSSRELHDLCFGLYLEASKNNEQ